MKPTKGAKLGSFSKIEKAENSLKARKKNRF